MSEYTIIPRRIANRAYQRCNAAAEKSLALLLRCGVSPVAVLRALCSAPAAALAITLLPAALQAAEQTAPVTDDAWRCQDMVEQGVRIRSCRSAPARADTPVVDTADHTAANSKTGNDKAPATQMPQSTEKTTTRQRAQFKAAQQAAEPVPPGITSATVSAAASVPVPVSDNAKSRAAANNISNSACSAALENNGNGNINNNINDNNTNFVAPDSNVPIEASALELALKENIVEYRGDVKIVRGPAVLRADSATYNRTSQLVELEGNVNADVPMAQMNGDRAEINLADNSTYIESARYELRQQGARGRADSVSIDAARRVTIENGSYTRCPEQDKHWEVKAGQISLDTESGQGSARNATLRVFDTPVLYFPYARFPIGDQRQSGLLFPRLSDTRAGVDLALPYYFNIAPNLDATLTPRLVQQAGYLTEAELRWLNHYDRWELGGAYIGKDNRTGRDRWLLDMQEHGSSDVGVSSEISFTRTSDADYLRDLSASSISVNRSSHLEQRASIAWQQSNWALGAATQRFQTIDTSLQQALRPYSTQPELWLQYHSAAHPARLATNFEVRAANFRHDTLVDGERGYAQIDFGLPLNWQGLRVLPSVGAQHLEYALDRAVPGSSDKSPAQTARFAALDISSEWVKWSRKTAPATHERRTLTPRLRYLHRELGSSASAASAIPLFDSKWHSSNEQLLFGNSRFAGYDVLEPAEQLSAGIAHGIYGSSGKLRGEFNIGQVFFLDRRATNGSDLAQLGNVLDNSATENSARSALLADYSWQHSSALQSLASLQWESESDQLRRGSWQLRYRGDVLPGGGRQLANLGYRYWRANPAELLLGRDIEQVDASVVTGLGRNWQLLARYQYDLTDRRSAESLAGVQYDDCCIQLRLVYRDGLIYAPLDDTPGSGTRAVRDHTLYLQIEFKGLAGVGRGLQNVLEESIFGYRAD